MEFFHTFMSVLADMTVFVTTLVWFFMWVTTYTKQGEMQDRIYSLEHDVRILTRRFEESEV